MSSWMLLMMVSYGTTAVPMMIHVDSEAACQEQGRYADSIAKTTKGVTVKWTCHLHTPPSGDGSR